ncbi:hypothetical protein [Proteiniphilum sp. X52]|uniref:hypothetical protein n=1 Tax=Proteiniphilum sp. X52 TaxID=2382159 RepID=UPI000F3C7805|nr:hypothetical protein [Proteiniphilum sp. X52]RNC66106.1 hypothetical protein D7D25_03995 [Proteiniphilum sp. X52]
MMNKLIIISLSLFLLSVPHIEAQSGDRDMDVRVGLGIGNLKKESDLLLLSEYELNVKWSDYFTIAPSIMLNHGGNSDADLADFFQVNLNAFGSPLRNDRRNDFRIGGGLSFYRLNKGGFYATRSAFGLNLIIEDSYMIKDRFFIGVKALIQPYFNKDFNSGVFLKAGINL